MHRFEDDYFDFAVGLDVLRVGGMTFRVGYFGQTADGASEQNASAKLTFAF